MMNIAIVRAFVALKEFALTYKELAEKISKLETKYNKQFADTNETFKLIYRKKKMSWIGKTENLSDIKNSCLLPLNQSRN